MSPQEYQRITEMLTRMPQGTLAWDPEYAEYLRWLAENAGICDQASNPNT